MRKISSYSNLVKDNKNLEKTIMDVKNTCHKIQSLLKVVLGMMETKDDSIEYNINDEDVLFMSELLPEYATVVMLLKTNNSKVLVYEMITNRCQDSFENQSTTDRNKIKR